MSITNAEKRRRYRERHPERVRDQQAKWRASTKGLVNSAVWHGRESVAQALSRLENA